MAIGPIDYSMDVIDPFQRAMQGWQRGAEMKQADNILKAQEEDAARKQQQFIAQQEQQKAMYDFSLKPNKTTQDFVDFTVRYPELSEPYKKSWEMMDTGQRSDSLKTAAQVMSAIRTGNQNIAQDILEEQAVALENSGNKDGAFNMRRMKGMITKDPRSIYASLGLFGSAVSPDEFGAMMDKFGANVRADQMQPYQIAETQAKTGLTNAQAQGQIINNQYAPTEKEWSIANIKSQIDDRAARLGLDRDTLQTNTQLRLEELGQSAAKLDPSVIKLINDSVVESSAAQLSANKQLDLANQFESAGGGFGRASQWRERIKELTGNQDAMTELRNEYTRIKNSEAMNSLPPGAASDADLALAMKGMPPETSDSKAIASFLRGIAKMNQIEAAHKQMQAEWANQNGTLGSSKKDLNILGVSVPSGTNFNKYYQSNLNKVLKEQKNQNIQQQIATGQASYMSIVK